MIPRNVVYGVAGAAAFLWLSWAAPARADARTGLDDFAVGRFSEAFADWRAAAEQGDAVSALYLGVLYDTGFGVTQDYPRALAWYERSGRGGNVTAMFNAAVMYDAGRGTAPDPAAAIAWYRRSIDAGSGRAAYNLALMYQSGSGTGRDREQAVRLYQVAAGRGVDAARMHLRELGQLHAGGAAQPSVDPAMVSFQRAEQVLLTRGTAQASQAVALFRRSAEDGNALAAYNLAYCYEHGLGVPANLEQAITWYRRSAAAASEAPIREIAEMGARNLMVSMSHAQR